MHKVGPDYQKECIMTRIYQQVILTYTFLSLMGQRLLRLIINPNEIENNPAHLKVNE